MENLDIFDPLEEVVEEEEEEVEVVLGGSMKVRRTSTEMKIGGGVSNWLERAFNDSECVIVPGNSDCQINATLTLGNFTTPIINSTSTVLPPSLGFDDNAMTDIIIYSVMFVVAAVGNLTVFITLFRNRHRKSRVNLMIMHLAAADLMVTLINFPLEVGWRITTQWVAGNLACKLFQFLRAFGLYLSSLVLVCISLDRYFAIVHPLKVNDAQRRGKIMLTFAWSIAAVCSLPQSVIFHVDTHPVFQNFKQCVTFGFFRTQVEEMTYNLFCLAAMYFMPLLVIIVVYFRILWEISQKSKDSKEEPSSRGGRGGRMRLRRSDMSNIERARARTLRMTVIIVLAFIWCWTPYVVIVMWYMFDRESAEQVDKRLQDALFIMAVSNSCVNPLVYGTYTINFRNELNRCFGRKTKPQVLARKSTGSTAMRTTVTAQLTTGSTLKMSTHTQVVQREGSGRGASRRAPSTESHYSPPHPRHPLLPSPLSQAPISTPTLSTSPTTSLQPVGQTVTASGCLMVEIEVDMDSQPSGDVVSTQLNDLTTTCTVQTATSTTCGVQTTAPTCVLQATTATTCVLQTTTPCVVEAASSKESQKENNSGASPSVSETRNKVTDSVKLTPILPPHGEAQITDNKTGRMKLTAFLRSDGKPPPTPAKFKDGQDVTKDTFILGRKFSADSGVFFDNRHKRIHHNSLIDIITDPADVRSHSDKTTNIELKSIRPLHDII